MQKCAVYSAKMAKLKKKLNFLQKSYIKICIYQKNVLPLQREIKKLL